MQRKSIFALTIALLLLTLVLVPAFSVTAVSPTTQPPPAQIDGALATAVINPSDDAPVQQGAPTATAPTSGYLVAGYYQGGSFADGLIRSYLKFNLSGIPADSMIVSATLHLEQAGGVDYPGQSRTVTFYRVTGNWDEDTITWNNRPAYSNAVGSTSTTYDYQDWVSFDVTEQVRNWVIGSQPNYGLVAIGPEAIPGIYRAFFASGYVGQPELHIRYLPSPPPVLDAWPGNLTMRASSTVSEAAPALSVGNVTRGTLAWTASKVGTASWLTLNQTGGSATPTTPGTVSFSVNATGLTPGTYTEQIRVSSSTAGVENSPIVTTFTLEILDTLHPVYLPAIMGGGSSGSTPLPKIVAVVVGISDYYYLNPAPSSGNLTDEWGYDLNEPKKDATEIASLMQTQWGVQPENIVLLTESSATRAGILAALDSAAEKVCPTAAASIDAVQACGANTLFIFYYSGHGGQTTDNNGDEGDGLDEFIAAYDTNLITGTYYSVITDDDLEGRLAAILSERTLVIVDSCFSGSLVSTTISETEGGYTVLRRGLINPLLPDGPAVVDALSELSGSNRLVITGGTGDQLTYESPNLENGVFTYFFLQGLTDSLNDVNGNGRISAEEAYWFSRDAVDDWVFNNASDHQNPAISDQVWGQVDLTAVP
ncbi:MAG: DNRLRE domain-containing protein [Ardenticatenaceae bacterium]|nr:DNRLRE domain-containing protein [Ardenticatenaceae bacterium]